MDSHQTSANDHRAPIDPGPFTGAVRTSDKTKGKQPAPAPTHARTRASYDQDDVDRFVRLNFLLLLARLVINARANNIAPDSDVFKANVVGIAEAMRVVMKRPPPGKGQAPLWLNPIFDPERDVITDTSTPEFTCNGPGRPGVMGTPTCGEADCWLGGVRHHPMSCFARKFASLQLVFCYVFYPVRSGDDTRWRNCHCMPDPVKNMTEAELATSDKLLVASINPAHAGCSENISRSDVVCCCAAGCSTFHHWGGSDGTNYTISCGRHLRSQHGLQNALGPNDQVAAVTRTPGEGSQEEVYAKKAVLVALNMLENQPNITEEDLAAAVEATVGLPPAPLPIAVAPVDAATATVPITPAAAVATSLAPIAVASPAPSRQNSPRHTNAADTNEVKKQTTKRGEPKTRPLKQAALPSLSKAASLRANPSPDDLREVRRARLTATAGAPAPPPELYHSAAALPDSGVGVTSRSAQVPRRGKRSRNSYGPNKRSRVSVSSAESPVSARAIISGGDLSHASGGKVRPQLPICQFAPSLPAPMAFKPSPSPPSAVDGVEESEIMIFIPTEDEDTRDYTCGDVAAMEMVLPVCGSCGQPMDNYHVCE